MTSKLCFSKVLRENFRHKTWLLALSALGNMLAIPVAFLMYTGRRSYYADYSAAAALAVTASNLKGFFTSVLPVTAGIIAIAGAMIVGLFGFRYVFHRNMTDTWHSVPVKRRTLFLAGWLNGLLIWLVPFLVSLLITLIAGETRLASLRHQFEALTVVTAEEMGVYQGWMTGGQLLLVTLRSAGALLVAFLLVYHLVLLAVMLCGNILNTLVTTAVLGVGVLSVYLLVQSFCLIYLDTFVSMLTKSYTALSCALHASPLADAVYVLYVSVRKGDAVYCLVSLMIALVLGCLALIVYLKRPSELAEQGMKNRIVCFGVQLLGSLCAALGGWLLFQAITQDQAEAVTLAWSVFGVLLAGTLAFGVLNIIFEMDFKAFLKHKPAMLAVLAAGVLTGFAFYGDWAGYDSYLPAEEEIAEISVYSYSYSNVNQWSDVDEPDSPLERTHIRDAAAAYAFLRDAVELTQQGIPEELLTSEQYVASERLYTKVTLKNGRSYYRSYRVSSYRNQSALTLLTTPEYMEINYLVDEETLAECTALMISRGDESFRIALTDGKSREAAEAIVKAYNLDATERPEALIGEGGRTFCTVNLVVADYAMSRSLEVNERMEYTIDALRRYGYGTYAEPVAVEEIAEIRLGIYTGWQEGETDLVAIARDVYGVPAGEESDVPAQEPEVITDSYGAEGSADIKITYDLAYDNEIWLSVSEAREMEELLGLISYEYSYNSGGVFRRGYVSNVQLVRKDGEVIYVMLPTGSLPEKYILRFGEL